MLMITLYIFIFLCDDDGTLLPPTLATKLTSLRPNPQGKVREEKSEKDQLSATGACAGVRCVAIILPQHKQLAHEFKQRPRCFTAKTTLNILLPVGRHSLSAKFAKTPSAPHTKSTLMFGLQFGHAKSTGNVERRNAARLWVPKTEWPVTTSPEDFSRDVALTEGERQISHKWSEARTIPCVLWRRLAYGNA